jgi:hypothetical protein
MEKQRGRKSAAALALPGIVTAINATERLPAPVHLSDAAAAVWVEVVNDQPASAFTPTHAPLLEMYCAHVVRSRVLDDQLLNFDVAWMADDEGMDRYDKLLKMAERESRAASSLATRLRITRQAIEHPVTAGRKVANQSKARKPWELPADHDD